MNGQEHRPIRYNIFLQKGEFNVMDAIYSTPRFDPNDTQAFAFVKVNEISQRQ